MYIMQVGYYAHLTQPDEWNAEKESMPINCDARA